MNARFCDPSPSVAHADTADGPQFPIGGNSHYDAEFFTNYDLVPGRVVCRACGCGASFSTRRGRRCWACVLRGNRPELDGAPPEGLAARAESLPNLTSEQRRKLHCLLTRRCKISRRALARRAAAVGISYDEALVAIVNG